MKLRAWHLVELRWWWEAPPAGEPVRLRDPLAARLYLGQLAADPAHAAALRRFLAAGAPHLAARPDDGEVLDQLARAVAAGRVRVGKAQAEPLTSWGEQLVDEALAEPVVRKEPAPAPEEADICWPCLLRAGASARALREASAGGAPFVVEG